jgi:hypothetical protein
MVVVCNENQGGREDGECYDTDRGGDGEEDRDENGEGWRKTDEKNDKVEGRWRQRDKGMYSRIKNRYYCVNILSH